MDDLPPIDWADYFHCLSDKELHDLATWLAAEGLKVAEFTDLVDRAYAIDVQASDTWRGRPLAFVACYGRCVAAGYAQRKRSFVGLMAALEDARMCGALPGEVAIQDLEPLLPLWSAPRTVEDLFHILERARDGPR